MLLLSLVIVLSVVTMSVCFSVKGTVNEAREENREAIEALSWGVENKQSEEKKLPVYTLIEKDGKIAVKGENGLVVRELDCRVMFLPQADREALKAGIEVSGDDALAAIIEDFES